MKMNGEGILKIMIGLISDCPTIKMYSGERFKALNDSGAALSLACNSIYNMIEDHYKPKYYLQQYS